MRLYPKRYRSHSIPLIREFKFCAQLEHRRGGLIAFASTSPLAGLQHESLASSSVLATPSFTVAKQFPSSKDGCRVRLPSWQLPGRRDPGVIV